MQDANLSPFTTAQVEARLRQLEGRMVNKAASLAKAAAAGAKGTPRAYDAGRGGSGVPQLLTTPKGYNADADVVAPAANGDKSEKKKKKRDKEAADGDAAAEEPAAGEASAKKKKKEKRQAEEEDGDAADGDEAEEKPKKKKKRDKE
jgi:hypothetical protein